MKYHDFEFVEDWYFENYAGSLGILKCNSGKCYFARKGINHRHAGEYDGLTLIKITDANLANYLGLIPKIKIGYVDIEIDKRRKLITTDSVIE